MCLSSISSIPRLLRASLQCTEFSISFRFHFTSLFFFCEWTMDHFAKMLKSYNWFLSTMARNKRKISNGKRIVKDLNYTGQIDLVILFFSLFLDSSEFTRIYLSPLIPTLYIQFEFGLSSSIILLHRFHSCILVPFDAKYRNINRCRRTTTRVQWKFSARKNLRFFQINFQFILFGFGGWHAGAHRLGLLLNETP